MMKYFRILLAGIFIIVSITGCFTVSVNFSGAKVHPDAKTFSVLEFTNRAENVEPGLALAITEALRDKVESQTPLKMTNGYGDITFEGEIFKYSFESKSITAEEVANENRFTIGIKVKYTNLLEPENNFDKNFERFIDVAGNVSMQNAEDENTEEIITNLIDDIFKEAFINW